MSDQAAVERARKVIEVAREFQVTDQPVPESGDEAIAVAEKLVGMAVNARSQNSKHAVIAPLLEAAGILADGSSPAAAPELAPVAPAPEPSVAAPAPEPQVDLASMFADPAPQGPVLGELIGLQPGEIGLTEEIVDKFLEKAKALEISSDDLIFISAVEFGRRTLSDLTGEMAKKLFNRILEEGQARLDGKGTFAPEPTVTHGRFEGEKIPVQFGTSTVTGSATTTSTMSLPVGVAVTQVPDAEPEALKGAKAEPFKAKYAPNDVLGPAFKAARERVNLTIEQAAEITKLKTAALAAYEDGAMRPQGKTIGLLADAYDCDGDELGQGRVSPTGEAAPASQAAVAEVAPDPVGPRDTPPWAEPDTPDPVAEAAPVDQAAPAAETPVTSDFVGQQKAFQAYAEAEMVKARLPVPQEPDVEAPEVPRDISKLNDVDLRSVHATYHFYYARAAWLSACEEADLEASDQVSDYEMNRKMLELERIDPSRSVTMIKAEAAQDPIVKKWADQVRAHRGRLRAYKNLRDIYLATCDRCSREFAVRGMDKRAVPS